MPLIILTIRNILRNPTRSILTIAGVAVAVLTFAVLRTITWSWTNSVDAAATDRVVTRHKITFVMPLPKRYIDDIRNTQGIKSATFANWFGAKDPKDESNFFASLAVDTDSFLSVYDEVSVPKDQFEAWRNNRRGAIIGEALAHKAGWKVGDKVTLTGTIYPGDWQFEIVGTYKALRKSFDRSTFMFHWSYLNDSIPESRRDTIGWVVSRVSDPRRSASMATFIDKGFDERDIQTFSQDEQAFNKSFLGMISTILSAIKYISIIILCIMVLILGNTIAMGVRERTHELGVLRAVGFSPIHLFLSVIGECQFLGLVGGIIGIALTYPLVNFGIGRFIEENFGAWFPYFRIVPSTAIWAVVLPTLLSVLAAVLPAYRAWNLRVVDALRRVG